MLNFNFAQFVLNKTKSGVLLTRFCIILFTSVAVNAQSVVVPLWPDKGTVTRDQLWNLSIVNGQSAAYNCKIEMVVSEITTNNPLFSAMSKEVIINKGNNIITPTFINPASYAVFNSSYNFNPTVNGLIPPGIFNVCYKLYKLPSEVVEVAGEECKILESDPLTPPTLIIPENNSTVNVPTPFFSWLPPVPNTSLPLLNYNIKVVEKSGTQSAQEAIERNLPVFNQTRILQNSCTYPSNFPKLDTGKVYAWQIVAYNENSYVGVSECWIFNLKRDSISGRDVSLFYTPLINTGSATIVNVTNDLRVSYNNEANDSLITLVIDKLTSSKERNSASIQVPVLLTGGVNNLKINLERFALGSGETIYELHLTNGRRERWWIDFKQKK